MNEHLKHIESASRIAFFAKAGWYSLVTSSIAPLIWFAIVVATDGHLIWASEVALCLLASSVISGIISIGGIWGHGRKVIILIAVIGIIAGIIFGFFASLAWSTSIC